MAQRGLKTDRPSEKDNEFQLESGNQQKRGVIEKPNE
jgi:hypothetical protein